MKKYIFLHLFLFVATATFAQKKVTRHTVSGTIKDARNGEVLIGVNVFIEELKTGVATNSYGFYALSVPPGKYKLSISYLGYVTQHKEIDLVDTDQKEIGRAHV